MTFIVFFPFTRDIEVDTRWEGTLCATYLQSWTHLALLSRIVRDIWQMRAGENDTRTLIFLFVCLFCFH